MTRYAFRRLRRQWRDVLAILVVMAALSWIAYVAGRELRAERSRAEAEARDELHRLAREMGGR